MQHNNERVGQHNNERVGEVAVLDVAELRRRAGAVLHHGPSACVFDPTSTPGRGDHDLNPDSDILGFAESDPRPAAVLVPIIAPIIASVNDHAGEAEGGEDSALMVLFTRRAEHLPAHAGQIAFPGGKIESRDSSPLEAALREAREEIGLDPALVEVLGYLDCYQTATGYRIVPVVGLITAPLALALDRSEVAEVFEVPLAFLLDAGKHERHAIHWKGALRSYYAIPYGERYIWGATAGIVRNLYEKLILRKAIGSC